MKGGGGPPHWISRCGRPPFEWFGKTSCLCPAVGVEELVNLSLYFFPAFFQAGIFGTLYEIFIRSVHIVYNSYIQRISILHADLVDCGILGADGGLIKHKCV